MPMSNESAGSSKAEETGPALAWSGDNPVAFGAALAALEGAGIPVHQMTEHDQFTVPQISGPQYRIFVPRQSFSAAEKAIREALPE